MKKYGLRFRGTNELATVHAETVEQYGDTYLDFSFDGCSDIVWLVDTRNEAFAAFNPSTDGFHDYYHPDNRDFDMTRVEIVEVELELKLAQ